ncbi:MAG: SDR family NAD(P)-dependent oxidoreductase [Acidobacteria bacterium]|nr:SDR family NAD(P)-dependent oxidoreductase [Acidobacteriota bacterium]
MRCKDQVVVITGASMGIGEALGHAFLAEGARIVLSSRDLPRLEAVRSQIGTTERTSAIACDVRDRAQIDNLVRAAKQRFGRIDVWINNAGYGMLDAVASMSLEECRRLFDTNFFGAIACMQAVIPLFQAQRAGTIINVSSVVGHLPVPNMSAYCASKHALNAVSEAARLELEPSGVRVMSVCPGRIKTNFGVNTVRGSEAKRLGDTFQQGISAERCARAIVNGYVRGTRELFVPWHAFLVSHLYEFWPQLVEFGMRRMMKSAVAKGDQIPA